MRSRKLSRWCAGLIPTSSTDSAHLRSPCAIAHPSCAIAQPHRRLSLVRCKSAKTYRRLLDLRAAGLVRNVRRGDDDARRN